MTAPSLLRMLLSAVLIVIPPGYAAAAGETLSAVAEKTGHDLALLQAANPRLSATEELVEGTMLAAPLLYIVEAETTLAAAAARLGTDDETLLAANPAAGDALPRGTVLVVPLGSGE